MATSTQTLVVGTRVQCALHYCGAGIVYAIHGEQSPDTVRTFIGGAGVSGGSARVDVVFANGHQAHQVPEAIVRGIQWRISDEVASAEMIAAALAHAACVQAQKRAVEDAAKAAYAAEVVRLQGAAEFAHLAQGDDRYSGTLAAANIRTELRRAFPGVKFSVRKSGHGTVNVRWTDGPTEAELKDIAGKYKRGSFNGMEDIYEDARPAWCEVFGGAGYVFCDREESDALIAQAIEQVCTEYAGNLSGMERPTVEAFRAGRLCYAYVPGLNDDLQALIRRAAVELRA